MTPPIGRSASWHESSQRCRDAQADAKQRASLINQRLRDQDTLGAAEAQHEGAKICLKRLCNEARCTDFSDLVEAERRSQDLIRLEAARKTCDEQLLVAAAGTELTAFCQQVEEADSYTLDTSIEELNTTIANQEEALRQLDQTMGSGAQSARMDGSNRAGQIAQDIQTILARLDSDVGGMQPSN